MADVIVSGEAADDLTKIFQWSVEQFGDDVAEAYVRDLQARLQILRTHPLVGEERTDTSRPYRVLRFRSHRLMYRFDGVRVRIVRILHAAQSAERALK